MNTIHLFGNLPGKSLAQEAFAWYDYHEVIYGEGFPDV